MYLKWVNTWKFTHEMVLLAADDTINADNPSFGYMDTMLSNWRDLGLDSPEKLTDHKQQLQQDKKRPTRPAATARGKTPPKENFAGDVRDLNFVIE